MVSHTNLPNDSPDRQTKQRTDRQTDRLLLMLLHRWNGFTQTYQMIVRQTDSGQTETCQLIVQTRQTADRQTDRQTNRQTDRQTDRQTAVNAPSELGCFYKSLPNDSADSGQTETYQTIVQTDRRTDCCYCS